MHHLSQKISGDFILYIMKFFRLIFLSVIILYITNACSPNYDEGPDFSIHSVRHKLEGKWKWERLYQDKKEQSAKYWNHTLTLDKDGGFVICNEKDSCYQEGFWTLPGRGKTKIVFNLINTDSTFSMDIKRVNLNYLSFQNGLKETETTFIRWDLTTVEKRNW